MIRSRRGAAAVLGAHMLAFAVLVSCSGGHNPFPSSLLSATTTIPVTFPDFSSVTLGSVGGVTTLTVALTPGKANLTGQVLDDTGAPVPGADVHVERLVGSDVASADIPAGPDGSWKAQGILGGLYRVRAWRPPDLAAVNPQIFFLGGSDTDTVNLQLQRFNGMQVSSSIAPNPPIIGQPAGLVVLVTASTVAADGTVHGQGRPGLSVELAGGGAWGLANNTTQVTDAQGAARWQVTCEALGQQPLSVVVGSTDSFPLDLPPCAPVPTTTTSSTSTTETGITSNIPTTTSTVVKRRATSP